jgi:hypothetical protein
MGIFENWKLSLSDAPNASNVYVSFVPPQYRRCIFKGATKPNFHSKSVSRKHATHFKPRRQKQMAKPLDRLDIPRYIL